MAAIAAYNYLLSVYNYRNMNLCKFHWLKNNGTIFLWTVLFLDFVEMSTKLRIANFKSIPLTFHGVPPRREPEMILAKLPRCHYRFIILSSDLPT